jgi:mitochondrial distribution and morphology protein 12
MSVDIQWETLTSGIEGRELAEKIREFIHDRFQQVPLPQFIRSVKVHSFDFGDIPPVIEVKDICDPHADFYEDDDDDDDVATNESDNATRQEDENSVLPSSQKHHQPHRIGETNARNTDASENMNQRNQSGPNKSTQNELGRSPNLSSPSDGPLNPLFLGSPQGPGIPGGTSNLTFFHLPYGPGLSGSTTPLAAVAGGQFHNAWPEKNLHQSQNLRRPERQSHHHSASVSSLAPSSSDPTSRPSSQHTHDPATLKFVEQLEQHDNAKNTNSSPIRESNDLQVVSHVKYSGNMNLVLTAEILLDYPMPSFVGVPFQLHITGFTFDGVSILAYAQKKVHFCFLSPEDARVFLGSENEESNPTQTQHYHHQHYTGGLLEEIRVESEIGQKDSGRQVLKNVGKVEKFILEQVRRIFENEFVFPSFWTFLV